MNKKIMWLILISIILISVLALSAYAQEQSFAEKIKEGLGYVATTLTTVFFVFSENPGVWMKVLIWIMVFTALFFAGQKFMDRKFAGTIAAVISFMVIIVIPNEVLIAIATTYGAIVVTLLIAIPFILIVVLTLVVGKPSRWTYWGLAICWIIFLLIMSALENSLEKVTGTEITGMAEAVIIIIWVIGVFVIGALIILGIVKGTPSGARLAGGKLGSIVSGVRKWVRKETKLEAEEFTFLKDAKRLMLAGNWDGALGELERAERLDKIIKNIDIVIGRVEAKVKKLEDQKHADAPGLKRTFNRFRHDTSGIMAMASRLRTVIENCEGFIRNKRPATWVRDAVTAIDQAIRLDRRMFVMTEDLVALEKEIEEKIAIL